MRLAGVAVVALLLISCGQEPEARPVRPRPPRGLRVDATVLTLRESSHPPTRALLHRIAVAGGRVRITSELDRWRILDLEAGTVTWVDDVSKTYRTFSHEELIRARRRQIAAPIPGAVEPVAVRRTGRSTEIDGRLADELRMTLGGYEREIWLSREPLIAPEFLRMWTASDPISEPWAGVMSEVQETLMESTGFPLVDRSRLVWEGGSLLFQRRLVDVEERKVSASLFEIPEDYEDTTPASIRSAGGRPPAE